MFAPALYVAQLAVLIFSMGLGGGAGFLGLYSLRIYKGTTRAARLLDAVCWAIALLGILLFIFAASCFVPMVLR